MKKEILKGLSNPLAEFGVTKHEIVMENGLKTIFIEKPFAPISAKIVIGAGSVFHPLDNGLAHMTEHLLSRHKNKSQDDFYGVIESVGGYRNMYTSEKWMSVNAEVADISHLGNVEQFFSRALSDIYVNKKILDKEKEIVFSEIQRSVTRNSFYGPSRYFRKCLSGDSPWANSVLGTVEGMRDLKVNEIKNFFHKHCVAENMLLVVAGGCKLLDIQKTFSKIKLLRGEKIELPPGPELLSVGQRFFYKKDDPQTMINFFFNGPLANTAESYILEFAMSFAHHGMTSRFYKKIREEKGLAYTLKNFYANANITEYVGTEVGVPNDKVDETIDAIIECYRGLLKDGITDEQLAKKVETWWFSVKRNCETSESWVETFDYLYEGDNVEDAVGEFPDLHRFRKQITSQDVRRVLEKYIKLDEFHLIIAGPESSKKYF